MIKEKIMSVCGMVLVAMMMPVAMLAQYSFSGVLADSVSGDTEPFATVRVYNASDVKQQKAVKVEATDADGKFSVALKSAGSYRATFSVVGKKPAVRVFDVNDANKSIDFGRILTVTADNVLGELVVEASRPLVKADVDKITYDLEADPDSKTNTMIEMLRKVPMVTVDGEDNIKVNGSGSFKVLVNGKPNTMMTKNPKEVFRAFPASSVKKIEVVTDPGAKYDAEGVGGVLNIVTVSETKTQGYTVSLNAEAKSRGFGGGAFASAQFGKFAFSANVHYNRNTGTDAATEVQREDFTSDELHNLSNSSKMRGTGNFTFGDIQASYELDSLNLFTLSGGMFLGSDKNNGTTQSIMSRLSGDRRYAYDMASVSESTFGGLNLGLDYQHSFKRPEEMLTVSYRLDYSPNGSKSNTEYSNIFDVPYSLYDQRFDNKAHTEEHTAQIDYVNPISSKHYIDFGAKYIYRKNYSDVERFTANDAGEMIRDVAYDNNYSQLRNIVAAYTDYKFQSGGFGAKAGVRYEYTFMNVKYKLSPDRNYSAKMSDLVPSAMLSYSFGMSGSLKLAYSMRINRPGIDYLNPYIDDSTPTEIKYGNPNLDTEKSHTLRLEFSRFSQKFMINAHVGYNFSDNRIEQYSVINQGVVSTTYGNIVKDHSFNLGLWANYTPWAKTRIMLNLDARYKNLRSAQLDMSTKGFSCNYFGNVQQTFPLDFVLSVYAGGSTPNITLQNKTSSFFFYGASLSKSFLKDKRLNVAVHANFPFTKQKKIHTELTGDSFKTMTDMYYPMREFSVSVSWRFGAMNTEVKRTARSISNDDVMQRSNSSGNASSTATSMGGGM